MIDFIIRFLSNYRLARKYTPSRIRAIRGAWYIETILPQPTRAGLSLLPMDLSPTEASTIDKALIERTARPRINTVRLPEE